MLQVAGVLLLPLVYLGVAAQVEAALSGRAGVRLLQPARDLLRALRKGAARSATRPRGLLAVLAALGLGALAPVIGPWSPFAFHGDLAVFAGLLALYHHSLRSPDAPRSSPLQLLTVVAAVLAGSQVGLAELVASPRCFIGLVCAAAALLALRPVVVAERRTDALDRGLVRWLDGVVAVALSGLFVALVQPLARGGPSAAIHLVAVLALAAAVGGVAARVARPRPAAHALYFGGAALCEGLGVVLHLRGAE
ncbi:hypothetical protein [Nannocystis punicea]|uniref:Uncharacterized protein n=1 Tax=Nannocystis punicea TaxID=2995304 RepID=A0ABY7H5D8_9BACT|nr:hypothetical protein [Nannocystis poenicansa]WAS94295.1 hypothetical protein O0S08_49875 [Nannocystis poenicansa]